jgi:DNA-binding MarR family transcriptional regulator
VTMLNQNEVKLRFLGVLLVNLEFALTNLAAIVQHEVPEVSPISLYILRSLGFRDGQYASELARTVGRAATSFTPNLDKLESAGLVERRPDAGDRRAVRIHLTAAGRTFLANNPFFRIWPSFIEGVPVRLSHRDEMRDKK